jgi:hypothetical protein
MACEVPLPTSTPSHLTIRVPEATRRAQVQAEAAHSAVPDKAC